MAENIKRHAPKKSKAAIAKELGLDMDKLIKDISSDSVNNELLANRKIAVALGLRGTPAFIIGKSPATKEMAVEIIPGELNQENFLKVINSVR